MRVGLGRLAVMRQKRVTYTLFKVYVSQTKHYANTADNTIKIYRLALSGTVSWIGEQKYLHNCAILYRKSTVYWPNC